MDFIGKWKLQTFDGNLVGIDARTGVLKVGPPAPGQSFNAYGTPDKFKLQAEGGKYVAASGDGYKADLARSGDVSYFALVGAGNGNLHVEDLGIKASGPIQSYWTSDNGSVGRIAKSPAPPATTNFTQTVVTPGLAEIKSNGFPAPKPDLAWVYLSGADLSDVFLNEANLTGADLSEANLDGVPMMTANLTGADLTQVVATGMADFTDAVLTGANLRGSDLSGAVMVHATMTGADFTRAHMRDITLNNAVLNDASLIDADLSGLNSQIVGVDFTGADLSGAILTTATVRTIDITDANLTGAQLSNDEPENPTIFLDDVKLSSKTNLTGARMRAVDLRNHDLTGVVMAHADLTGSKLDNTVLNNVEFPYANLTGVSITGNVAMFGANFSNATLTGAKMPGAQMGSLSLLFSVVDDATSKGTYNHFLEALAKDKAAGVKQVFADAHHDLDGEVTVLASEFSAGRVWTVTGGGKPYTVRLQSIAGTNSLGVYEPATAAILTNAFMKSVVLTSANMYNVRASGAQIYGNALLDGQVVLEGAQLDNANLGGINLKQARLYGVNFDHSTLTDAHLDGAWLTPDARGGIATFANANLQGATFIDAKLDSAIFADAAVALPRAEKPADVDGVWLLSSSGLTPLVTQLDEAAKQFQLQAELAKSLVGGKASSEIRTAFQKHGVKLGEEALVTVQETGPTWVITNGSDSYLIFPGCELESAVPALAVNKGAELVTDFTIPLYLESDLKAGSVPEAVSRAFAASSAKVKLGPAAMIAVGSQNTDWQVIDAASSYEAWLGLDSDCNLAITVRPSMPAVLDLFANHSLPLTRRATVKVTSKQSRWVVDNDSNNPFNAVTNYIRFNIERDPTTATLDVFGSRLRVRRLSAAGVETFNNVRVRVTALREADLQLSTVCPNSNRTKTNKTDKIPFRLWMRANELPKPPFCIPSADADFYCPPSGK